MSIAGIPVSEIPEKNLLAGFGLANQAVARALSVRGFGVSIFDDKPEAGTFAAADALDLELLVEPDEQLLKKIVKTADVVIPSPGLPEHHPVFDIANTVGRPMASEFDLARIWDTRPIVAITGTSGKTTVTEMVVAALCASGISAMAAGNLNVPLVTAIDQLDVEMFVVEASSFRLGHSQLFEPLVGCWLNFAPDHLDVHRDMTSYETAKARLWQNLPEDAVAIANQDDATVMHHLPANRTISTFSSQDSQAHWQIKHDEIFGPYGAICSKHDLKRQRPHDLANALAMSATAIAAGAATERVRETLCDYEPGSHRLQKVATIDGVEYYNDSKATTPHATLAALEGFDSSVLIAGGRNKGLELSVLADRSERIHSVIALGEAADEITDVFAGVRPVVSADDMSHAVGLAQTLAEPPVTVLLSPACASFDSYNSYAERGEDFTQAVVELSKGKR